MTAASANLPRATRQGFLRSFPVAASVTIYEGAMVALDSSGYGRPARASTTDKIVGRCTKYVTNGTTAGAVSVEVDCFSIARYANSSSSDQITSAHLGQAAYVVDDSTVALTDNSGARVRAGQIFQVDSSGNVWIDFQAAPKLVTVSGYMADISTASSIYLPSPATGKVVALYCTLANGITVADSACTSSIAGNAITGGGLTAAYSGSAAGTTFVAKPTAANAVAAGQYLSFTTDGASSTTAPAHVTFVISVG